VFAYPNLSVNFKEAAMSLLCHVIPPPYPDKQHHWENVANRGRTTTHAYWLVNFTNNFSTSTRFAALFHKGLIEHGLTSAPTQYRLYGQRFYRSDDPTNSVTALKEGG